MGVTEPQLGSACWIESTCGHRHGRALQGYRRPDAESNSTPCTPHPSTASPLPSLAQSLASGSIAVPVVRGSAVGRVSLRACPHHHPPTRTSTAAYGTVLRRHDPHGPRRAADHRRRGCTRAEHHVSQQLRYPSARPSPLGSDNGLRVTLEYLWLPGDYLPSFLAAVAPDDILRLNDSRFPFRISTRLEIGVRSASVKWSCTRTLLHSTWLCFAYSCSAQLGSVTSHVHLSHFLTNPFHFLLLLSL